VSLLTEWCCARTVALVKIFSTLCIIKDTLRIKFLMQLLSSKQLNPSTVKEVSLSCLDDNSTFQVCAGQRINLRILLVLSGPISDVQIYLGVRGTARGIKTDFNTEGAGYSKKLATSNQLIFDGTEPGSHFILMIRNRWDSAWWHSWI
jgi:hypothetical protein